MRYTLTNLFNEFMLECEYSKKLRPETLKGYREVFRVFIMLYPEACLDTLSSTTLTAFFKTLDTRIRIVGRGTPRKGVKKSTIAKYWSKLNGFFKWLKANNHITHNPFEGMAYPSPVFEDRKFLNKEQVERILGAIHNCPDTGLLILKRNLVLFYILLFCGLRRDELLSLQLRDIDLPRRILTVRAETSKVQRTRYIPIHSKLAMYLKDYLNERRRFTTQYLLVSSKRDDRLTRDGLKHLTNRLRASSGVVFHAHQFRHTFAVNFLNNGGDIAKLKQLMGHADIRMTIIYLRCLPTNAMKRDIEKMNLDSFI